MRSPPPGWPPDELLARAAKALAPHLGRDATAREAREFLLKMREYFHLLREGERLFVGPPGTAPDTAKEG